MMRPFTQTELQQLEADRVNMRILWDRFKYEYQNCNTSAQHAPPVVVQACYTLIEEILDKNIKNTNPTELSGYAKIVAAMFEFGQYCHKNGFYISNMQQCICCQVHDEDLQRLLDGQI